MPGIRSTIASRPCKPLRSNSRLLYRSVDTGSASASVQADVHIVTEGDCFDPRTCCDEREQALIAALRAYLRPDVAPECLMARLKATLDHCCGEDK